MGKGLSIGSKAWKFFDLVCEDLDDWMGSAYCNPSAALRAGGIDAYEERRQWNKKFRKQRAEQELKKLIGYLDRLRYIQIRRKGKEVLIKLTEKGRMQALKQVAFRGAPKLSDGQRCYISFDIPNQAIGVRDALRGILKRSDFSMVYHSLWTTDRSVVAELRHLVEDLKAERWVHVFLGKPQTTLYVHRKKSEK
jgi:hypothetical protein